MRRLRRTSRAPAHVVEMIVTSALIPFLSVYWRLRGALHFRGSRYPDDAGMRPRRSPIAPHRAASPCSAR